MQRSVESDGSNSLGDFSNSDDYESSFIDNDESYDDLDGNTDSEENYFSNSSSTSEDGNEKKQKKILKGCKTKNFSLF